MLKQDGLELSNIMSEITKHVPHTLWIRYVKLCQAYGVSVEKPLMRAMKDEIENVVEDPRLLEP